MAALRKQVIPAVMSAGLDQGKDPKLVSQGLLKLENALCTKSGEFRKRLGLSTLTGTITENDLAVHNDRVYLLGDKIRVVEGSTISECPGLTYPTGYLDIDIAEVSPYNRGQKVLACEVASYGNVLGVSMEVQDPVTLAVTCELLTFDSRSMRVIDQATGSSADIGHFRVMPTSTGMVAVNVVKVGSDWYPHRRTITSAGVIGAATQMTATGKTCNDQSGLSLDAVMLNETGPVYLVVHQLVTSLYIEAIIHNAGTDYVWTNAFSGAAINLKGCYRQSNTVGIVMAYVTGTPKTLKARGVAQAGFTGSAGTAYSFDADDLPITATGYATGAATSNVYVGVMRDALTDSSATKTRDSATYANTFNSSTAAVGTAYEHIYGCWPIAKPLIDASRIYLPVVQQGSSDGINRSLLLVDGSGGLWARILEDCVDRLGGVPGSSYIDNCANIDGMLFCAPRKNGQTSHSVAICTASRSGQIKGISTPRSLMIPGSAPLDFDGVRATEQGFWHYPRGISLELHATGGATDIGTGIYGYCALYEYYDSNGQRHRSAPSEVASIDVGAQDSVHVSVPTLKNTAKFATVHIVVYRTAVNGSVYYRLTQVLNAPETDDEYIFTDSAADSTITAGEAVYTMGGVLENMPPPAYRVSCVHQDRQFVVARISESWDIRYSKAFVEGDGVAFNEALSIVCSPAGGDITALASFGDRLVIFKGAKIFATDGTGLSDVGQGKGYSPPYLISEAVGCTNQKAITEIPQGLLFLGADGIYLLDKTLNVQLLSDPVAEEFAGVTITSAATVSEHSYAIFVSNGSALVYDYKHGLWSTFTRHAATDACVADELYALVGGSAILRKQNAVHYDIEGSSLFDVSLKIRTGWFSFAQLLGFQRLYRVLLLGQSIDNHKLRVKEAFNFEPEWVYERLYDARARQFTLTGESSDDFGMAIDIDAHGEWAVIGIPGTAAGGEVELHRRFGNRWVKQDTIIPTDLVAGDAFGRAVRLDHGLLIVGAPGKGTNTGAAYVFEIDTPINNYNWAQLAKLVASDGASGDKFGWCVDIDGATRRAIVGAPWHETGLAGTYLIMGTAIIGNASSPTTDSGAIYIYEDSGTAWTQVAHLIGGDSGYGDMQGNAVGISGTAAFAGAPRGGTIGNGCVYAYRRPWAEEQKVVAPTPVAGDDFGCSVDLRGTLAAIGAPNEISGLAGDGLLFTYSGSWTDLYKVEASDQAAGNMLGAGAALSGDLSQAVFGAPTVDAAYVFGVDDGLQKMRLVSDEDMDDMGWGIGLGFGGETVAAASNTDGVATFFDTDRVHFDTAEHYGAGTGELVDKAYMLQLGLTRQRCTSVMLEISDEACAGETVLDEGYALTGISFLVGIESDATRLGRGRNIDQVPSTGGGAE